MTCILPTNQVSGHPGRRQSTVRQAGRSTVRHRGTNLSAQREVPMSLDRRDAFGSGTPATTDAGHGGNAPADTGGCQPGRPCSPVKVRRAGNRDRILAKADHHRSVVGRADAVDIVRAATRSLFTDQQSRRPRTTAQPRRVTPAGRYRLRGRRRSGALSTRSSWLL